MTKCPPRHCKPTTSFFYKVLVSIKQLQSKEKYCNGASLEDIEKFMGKTYCLTGDIRSQLENALSIADQSRLVVKRKKYYSLVSPAANLHVIPEPCVKAKLEEIQQSFNTVPCTDKNSLRKSRRIQFSQKIRSDCDLGENISRKKKTRRSRSRSRSSTRKNKECRALTPCRSRSRSPSRSMSPKNRSRSKSPKKNDKNGSVKGSDKEDNVFCKIKAQKSKSPFMMPSKSCLKKTSDKNVAGMVKDAIFGKKAKSPCDSDSSDN